jgi:hypothetical protein
VEARSLMECGGKTRREKEYVMPRTKWVDTLDRALSEAWIEDGQMPDEHREERIRAFEQWWGSFETNALMHALHESSTAHMNILYRY